MATQFKMATPDSWILAASNSESVLVSHTNVRQLRVYIGTTAPDEDSAYHSICSEHPFSMSGVSGQSIYIRSGGDFPIRATVTTG